MAKNYIPDRLIPTIQRLLDYKTKKGKFSIYPCSPDYAPELKELEKYGLLKATLSKEEGELQKRPATNEEIEEFFENMKLWYRLEDVKWGTLSRIVEGEQSQTKKIGKKKRMKPAAFDKKESILNYGNRKLEIPLDTKEYSLCKVMFNTKKGEPVAWIDIADEHEGTSEAGLEKEKSEMTQKSAKDIVIRVNKKARNKLKIPKLFDWKKGEIIRLV